MRELISEKGCFEKYRQGKLHSVPKNGSFITVSTGLYVQSNSLLFIISIKKIWSETSHISSLLHLQFIKKNITLFFLLKNIIVSRPLHVFTQLDVDLDKRKWYLSVIFIMFNKS